MFETPLTVVGHIVNDLQRRKVGDQEVIKFRVASNSRRRTGDGSWEPGNSLFITVNCWGKLVTGVGAALGKGAPVIVVGHVYTSEYEDRDGNRRSSLEMRATSVGPDLSRAIVRIETRLILNPLSPYRGYPSSHAFCWLAWQQGLGGLGPQWGRSSSNGRVQVGSNVVYVLVEQVGVHVERHAGLGVTQHPLHRLDVGPCRHRQRRRRVP
jgi:single-strand DNA-binding protein